MIKFVSFKIRQFELQFVIKNNTSLCDTEVAFKLKKIASTQPAQSNFQVNKEELSTKTVPEKVYSDRFYSLSRIW